MWFVTAFLNTLMYAYRFPDFRAEAEKSHRATYQLTGRAQGMPGLRALDHQRAIRRGHYVGHPENEPRAIVREKVGVALPLHGVPGEFLRNVTLRPGDFRTS